MELCIIKHQTLLKNKRGQAQENKGRQDKEAKRGQAWKRKRHRTEDERTQDRRQREKTGR